MFEAGAVGISSLMHQPSTGHPRSGSAVLLAQSQRRNAASILQKFLLILSLLSFPFSPSSFSGSLCPSARFWHFLHTSFVSFNYCTLLPPSQICLSPVSLPIPALLHTLHNSSSVFPAVIFASVWFKFFSGMRATANTQPSLCKYRTVI